MGQVILKNKKILVTGGNGYLGRHLVAQLRRAQAQVSILDRAGANSAGNLITDITDAQAVQDAVRKVNPDIVFHLAASMNRARDFDRYDEIHEINFSGTRNLLFALRETSCSHFIFTSTSEVYGANRAPFRETQLPDPVSPYSLTKVLAEHLIRTFGRTYQMGFTILRLFNFFGPDMPPHFFIPVMVRALRENRPFEMTEGAQKRDFLYVDDVVRAMILAAEHVPGGETYNVCSGRAVSLRELVLEVKQLLNSRSEILFGARPYRRNEIWNMEGDPSKIQEAWHFRPQYDLRAGIARMLGNEIPDRGEKE